MAEHSTTGFAPIDANWKKLWTDSCSGVTKNQLRIYDTAEAAERNKVEPTDLIKEVRITWEA